MVAELSHSRSDLLSNRNLRDSNRKRKRPFDDWLVYNPSPRMNVWREIYEDIIEEALDAKEILDEIRNLLYTDTMEFCDECEAMKCYGSLHPICEPVLDMLKEMFAH